MHGHGTHCAATIFGRDVDGTRIGVAPGVEKALIGKVLGDDGTGSSIMLFDAMNWAVSEGAQVISMSLGFDFPGFADRLIADGYPPLLATSIAIEGYRMNINLFNSLMETLEPLAEIHGGCVVVAAAGNESLRDIDSRFEVSASLPAAATDVISVGALGQGTGGLEVADFSNTNPVLSAPGVSVISAQAGGGLVAWDGSSMAAPHVAGVTALWWQRVFDSPIPPTAEAVKSRLRAGTVIDVFAPGQDILDRGEGLVRAPVPGAV